MFSIHDNYIKYPNTLEELQSVMDRYESLFLPGCAGSIDVVHVKWRNCPAGNAIIVLEKRSFKHWCFRQYLTISVESLESLVYSLEHAMISVLINLMRMLKESEKDGTRMCFGAFMT
jgi:hypothetical protein